MDQLSKINNKLVNIVYFTTLVFCLFLVSSFVDLSSARQTKLQVKAQANPLSYFSTPIPEANGDLIGGSTIAESIAFAKSQQVAGVEDVKPSATTLGGAVHIAMENPKGNHVLGATTEMIDGTDASTILGSMELAKLESKREFSVAHEEPMAKVKGESTNVYFEKPNLSSIKGSIDYAMMLD